MSELAYVYAFLGKYYEAERLYKGGYFPLLLPSSPFFTSLPLIPSPPPPLLLPHSPWPLYVWFLWCCSYCYLDSWLIIERSFGQSHPDVAVAMSNIAWIYFKQVCGKREERERRRRERRKCVRERERVRGEESSYLLLCNCRLAMRSVKRYMKSRGKSAKKHLALLIQTTLEVCSFTICYCKQQATTVINNNNNSNNNDSNSNNKQHQLQQQQQQQQRFNNRLFISLCRSSRAGRTLLQNLQVWRSGPSVVPGIFYPTFLIWKVAQWHRAEHVYVGNFGVLERRLCERWAV